MIIKPQKVKVRWNGKNKDYYLKLGYDNYEYNKEFIVDIDDLPKHSHAEVLLNCDYCGELFTRKYSTVNRRECNQYCNKKCADKGQNKGISKNDRISNSLDGLLKLYLELNRCPTVKEFDDYARNNQLLKRRNLETNLSMKWNEICKTYLGEANQYSLTKEALYDSLRMLKNELGHTPTLIEIEERGICEKKQFYRRFNKTYSEIITDLGWELSTPILHIKTNDELLNDFYNLYLSLGRIPSRYEIDTNKDIANWQTYLNRFSTLESICDILEIKLDDYINNISLGLGITCLDANGNICKSIPEKIISDILISNDIKFVKEFPYKKVIDEVTNNTNMDWYIEDHNIGIEYFGLFNEKYIDENSMIGRYTRKAIEKMNITSKNNFTLIDLYPADIENNFEGLQKKLVKYNIKMKVDNKEELVI